MAGTLKTNRQQLGDSATATQNFTITAEAADGTMKIARGNAGATTQDILTVDASGNAQLTKTTSQSMVRVRGGAGWGSTNTAIRRFTTTDATQGSDITYLADTVNGDKFTINTNGIYSVTYCDDFSTQAFSGLTLNSAALTTGVQSINDSTLLAAVSNTSNAGNFVSWSGYLPSSSVIRAHTATGLANGSNTPALFTIVRVS